jgi:hypothetical protein
MVMPILGTAITTKLLAGLKKSTFSVVRFFIPFIFSVFTTN